MSRKQRARRLAEAAVAIRAAAQSVSDARGRRRLLLAELRLREELGDSVPKSVAAQLLGVSPTAVERWVDAGKLPVVNRPGGRQEIAAEAFLDLANEVARQRDEGVTRGVLAAAFKRLERRGRPRRRPRPNESAAELRAGFTAGTPADRLRETAELSFAIGTLARAGARHRARTRAG